MPFYMISKVRHTCKEGGLWKRAEVSKSRVLHINLLITKKPSKLINSLYMIFIFFYFHGDE